jgi:uroporphyrinogen-III decarboxylase
MAGVDVNRIRAKHPKWCMIGGFDKTVMHKGEAALRAEFERIKPAVLAGYYIPSCDHQTPPAVSVDDYRLYVRLLHEFSDEVAAEARKAMKPA